MLTKEERGFLQIDPHNLEEEIFVWADIRGQYADMEADVIGREVVLKVEVDVAKETLSRVQGSLLVQVAQQDVWLEFFSKAPTAPQALGWANSHKDYLEALNVYNDLRKQLAELTYEKGVLHAMVASLDGKRKCLENANSSYISGYWGVSGENAVQEGKRKGVINREPSVSDNEYRLRKDRIESKRKNK